MPVFARVTTGANSPVSRRKLSLCLREGAGRLTGKALSTWRHFVCLWLIAILPVWLVADDTAAAMLRNDGGVQLNKNPAPASAALFVNDLIETQSNATARIEATGSTVDINADTVVQFEGDELVLDHGSLAVNTSRGLRVRVGCVTITPVNPDWTHYEVTDREGKVSVSALKNDVYLEARSRRLQDVKQSGRSERSIVREGEQKSREESCGGAKKFPASSGGFLNSPYTVGTATGVIVGVGCWALCRGDNPVSPDRP